MPKPTAQAIGRMCLGDGIDLGHTPAAFGMGAKKGTGIIREPETAEGSQGPPATVQDPQNTTSVGRKVLPQGFLLPITPNPNFALAVGWHPPLPVSHSLLVLPAPARTAGQAVGWEEQGTQSHAGSTRICNSQA